MRAPMPRLWVAMAVALAACSSPAPAPAEPPRAHVCVALRAEIEAVHARVACYDDAECELAPGILPFDVTAREEGSTRPRHAIQGADHASRPCGTAIHHDSRAALDDVLARFTAAGCGPISTLGSTDCAPTSHGARAMCSVGVCQMGM